ncbi:MAG: cellulase family glycosylhydrolase [Clostridia bacterium]|nr:cellulase family glycosylhydrolase [Clostridia bacterium]
MTNPIIIHPGNRKIFEYKGKPVVLFCATEHYGAVMNRPFDFKAYLDYCGANGQNYTRLFLLFRELQTPLNPYSTCKPESTDYISPYVRTGPGPAADGLLKYDLDIWNEEYFERLHGFMACAEENDVIVEATLFSNEYTNDLFSLIPFHPGANVNNTGDVDFAEWMSRKNETIFGYQKEFIRKIVGELNRYPNLFYEICNEPVCFKPGLASADDINAWQRELIDFIRMQEEDLPNKHLVAVTECWTFDEGGALSVNTDLSFSALAADIANVHPLPGVKYGGRTYDLGLFMSKQLKLGQLRDYCLDSYKEGRPLNLDEDNIASRFMDEEAWTIHRKRAWTTIFCGAHYDYIDFSIINRLPTGTVESGKHLHRWFCNLREYMGRMDLVNGRPLKNIVTDLPDEVLESVFGIPDGDIFIYLADQRELTDEKAGTPVEGRLAVNLCQGGYAVEFYSPESGMVVGESKTSGGNAVIALPRFSGDIAIRLFRI